MKTNKYNYAIDAFTCDFDLALDELEGDEEIFGEPLFVLNEQAKENEKFLEDIDLLRELNFGLRHGTIEIHEVDNKGEIK